MCPWGNDVTVLVYIYIYIWLLPLTNSHGSYELQSIFWIVETWDAIQGL